MMAFDLGGWREFGGRFVLEEREPVHKSAFFSHHSLMTSHSLFLRLKVRFLSQTCNGHRLPKALKFLVDFGGRFVLDERAPVHKSAFSSSALTLQWCHSLLCHAIVSLSASAASLVPSLSLTRQDHHQTSQIIIFLSRLKANFCRKVWNFVNGVQLLVCSFFGNCVCEDFHSTLPTRRAESTSWNSVCPFVCLQHFQYILLHMILDTI